MSRSTLLIAAIIVNLVLISRVSSLSQLSDYEDNAGEERLSVREEIVVTENEGILSWKRKRRTAGEMRAVIIPKTA